MSEDRDGGPVLGAAVHPSVDEGLLRHRLAGSEDDHPRHPVDLARRDAREPLVQARRIAGELPDLVDRSLDADLVADRPERHAALSAVVPAMKSTMTCASSAPLSSWR